MDFRPRYLGVFDRVENGEALVKAVEAVVGVGLLEAEVQAPQLGALHLFERLLKPARLQPRLEKTQPSVFFCFFCFFYIFAQKREFLGFFSVSRILLGANRL